MQNTQMQGMLSSKFYLSYSVKKNLPKWWTVLSGFWNITVYGRKHCYRLYTKHFNEAVHWACAIQKIIDTKAPVETPTQLLIRDIEVGFHWLFHYIGVNHYWKLIF